MGKNRIILTREASRSVLQEPNARQSLTLDEIRANLGMGGLSKKNTVVRKAGTGYSRKLSSKHAKKKTG